MAQSSLTTIVVIAHNYGAFLPQAVASAADQTRVPAILVIDDASTDDTPAIVEALRRQHPAIEAVRLAENVGLSRVRNLAAARVATEWVTFLDADDWLDARYIEDAETLLATIPQVDVITPDMTIVRDGARRVFTAAVPEYWDDLLARNTIVQSSLIRRGLITRIGGYDPALDFEDWDFWIRVLQAGGRIARLPGAYVFRREHGRNKSKRCDEAAATEAVRRKHRALLR